MSYFYTEDDKILILLLAISNRLPIPYFAVPLFGRR